MSTHLDQCGRKSAGRSAKHRRICVSCFHVLTAHIRTREVDHIFFRRADRNDIKHPLGRVPAEAREEALRGRHALRQRSDASALRSVRGVPRKEEDLEARVGREEVLDVVRAPVRGAHEHVRDDALADGELRGARLVLGRGERRGFVVHADAGREEAEGLEGPESGGTLAL